MVFSAWFGPPSFLHRSMVQGWVFLRRGGGQLILSLNNFFKVVILIFILPLTSVWLHINLLISSSTVLFKKDI